MMRQAGEGGEMTRGDKQAQEPRTESWSLGGTLLLTFPPTEIPHDQFGPR